MNLQQKKSIYRDSGVRTKGRKENHSARVAPTFVLHSGHNGKLQISFMSTGTT